MAKFHGRKTVVYVDGYDVSGDSNNVEAGIELDTAEATSFADTGKNYVAGPGGGKVTHGMWLDDAAGRAHRVLSARIGSSVQFACAYGSAQGDLGWAGSAVVSKYGAKSPIGGAAAADAEYLSADSTGIEPIKVLKPLGAGTAAEAAFDDGAGSNNGLRGYLQITNVLGGTPVFTLEHSATGTSGWGTALTFTGSTAPTAQGLGMAGTVSQFLRANVSGGSATAWLGFRRL